MTKIPLPPSINTMSTSPLLDDNNVDDVEEITFEFIETPKASSTSTANDDERQRATDFAVEQAHQPGAVTTTTTNSSNAPTIATTTGDTAITIPPRFDNDVGSSPPPGMNRNRVSGTSRKTTADDDDDDDDDDGDDALLPTTSTTLTLSSSSSAIVVPPTTTSSSSKISTATAAATATNRDTIFGVFRVCSMVMMMMLMMIMMMMVGRRADHSAMGYVSISPPIRVPLGEPPSHNCHPRAQAIDTHARAHAQQLQQLLPEQQRQQEQEHQQTEFEKRIMSTVKSELQAVIQSFTSNMIQRFNAQLLATAAVEKAATEAAALSAETSTGSSTSSMGDTTSSSADSTKEVKVNIAGEASQPITTATTSVIDDRIEKKAASLDSTGNVDHQRPRHDHRDNYTAHQSVDDSATTTTGLKDKQQQQQQHQRMGVASRHYLEFALWIMVLLFIVFNLCKCCGGRRRHNVTNDNDANKRRFGKKRQRLSEVDDFDDQLFLESLLRSTPSPRHTAPTTPRGGGAVTIDLTKKTIREIPRGGHQQPVPSRNSNSGGYRVINTNRSSNFPPSSTNSTTSPPIISKEQARANAMIFAKRDKQRLEEARGTIHTGCNNSRDNVYTTRTISPSSTNNTTPVVSKQQARENAKIFAKRDQLRLHETRGTSDNRGRDPTGINTGTIPSSSMNSKILKRVQARANALKFAKRDKKRLDDAKK